MTQQVGGTADSSPRKRSKRLRWLIWSAAVIVLLVAGALILYSQPAGKRLALRGTGLFVDVPTAPARIALPAPSGAHPIGTIELHLVDSNRSDPWVDGHRRELMVSAWYPAADTGTHVLAPYMRQQPAQHFKRISLEGVGLQPEDVDLAGVRTHAWVGAAVDARLGPQPIVLFSHGGSLMRAFGTVLVEDLASRGYIVVAIDHTHEAAVVEFPDGRLALDAVPRGSDSFKETLKKMITVRVQDTRFLLDQLELIARGTNPDAAGRPLPAGLANALDLSNIGIFGHSAGGFTAAQAIYHDPRLDAGINLDGSLGFDIAKGEWAEVTHRGLDRPFMLMGAGFSGPQRLPHTHQHAPDWKSLWQHSTGWKLDLYFAEGEHFTFADHQAFMPQLDARFDLPDWLLEGMIGTIHPARAIASQRAYIAAFFDQHLRGKPQVLLEGPSPDHPDVDFILGNDDEHE